MDSTLKHSDEFHNDNVSVSYYNEGDFSPARPDCPNPELWHTYDHQGTEIEVIELVHGFIRGLQPSVCLETGTSRGFMAQRIGDALAINGHGTLYTYEPDPDVYQEAQGLIGDYDNVVSYQQPSMVPWTHGPINFAWFDSLLWLRWKEFDFYQEYMTPGTIVCFHDTSPRFGGWSDEIRKDPRLITIDLPTPRGALIGRLA